MDKTRTHRYTVTNRWTGNLGTGTSSYRAYSRNHELTAPRKEALIAGSSDPAFRGDPARYNPEELLVSAVSACHMLWALHLCADAGIVVIEYTDEAVGEVVEHPDGSGEFSRILLRPQMLIQDGARIPDALAVHDRVPHFCCLARSVKATVEHQVRVAAVAPDSAELS